MSYKVLWVRHIKFPVNMTNALVWCNTVQGEACFDVLQCEPWPAGGAGLMLTGAGFTTGSTVVCRGWMMIVLACMGAAAWANGTAVISGLGWMETFGPIWIGFLTGCTGLAGVHVCICQRTWMEVVRQGNGIRINILSSGKQICIYSYKLFLKDFFFQTGHDIPEFCKPILWCKNSKSSLF